MILKGSEAKLLRTFWSEPFHFFSIKELSKKTNLSRNWIYKLINKFENLDMLIEERKAYRLNFSNLLCRRFKLLFDSELIASSKMKEKILSVTERIVYEMSPKSIVLVGSVAAGKEIEGSDIDFFVLSEKKKIPLIENINVVVMRREEFEKRYLKGDDFVVSALAYGRIIYDQEFFIKFYEKPLPVFSEEIIQEKIQYCETLSDRIYALLRVDEERAREELLHLALNCARVILLRKRKIPGTKHDIALQVKDYNGRIAEIIDTLMKGEKTNVDVILNFVKECMTAIGQI